jgi:sulfide dehydrogenase cytochrome subunit
MRRATYHLLINMLTITGLTCPVIAFADTSKPELNDTASRRLHIRSLAASCAACHGTNGNPYPAKSATKTVKLAGVDSAYFIAQMQAFKSGERVSTVMHRHAKGLNSQEVSDLAAYFSAQVPTNPPVLPSQKLSRNTHH